MHTDETWKQYGQRMLAEFIAPWIMILLVGSATLAVLVLLGKFLWWLVNV